MSTRIPSSALETLWNPAVLFKLSYPLPPTAPEFFPQYQHYGIGYADIIFVISYAVLFAILREVVMRGVFAPFIRSWLRAEHNKRVKSRQQHKNAADCDSAIDLADGVVSSESAEKHKSGGSAFPSSSKGCHDVRHRPNSNRKTASSQPSRPAFKRTASRRERSQEKKVTRFAEQGWSFTYYLVYWSFGTWIHYNSPAWPFNLDALWIGYPDAHIPVPGPVKFYYLSQLAFWFNQLVVINVEERRKDHYQMLSHHIITSALMIMSYCAGLLRVGSLILVLLDFCDILLPLAKMFKYMSLDPLADATFTFFLVSWLVTRQGLYSAAALSVVFDCPRIIGVGDCPTCQMTFPKWVMFSGLLCSLAVLLLLWLVMIIRVAWRVIRGKGAEDTRSDDEDSASED